MRFRSGRPSNPVTISPGLSSVSGANGPLSIAASANGRGAISYRYGPLGAVHVVAFTAGGFASPVAVSALGYGGASTVQVGPSGQPLTAWSASDGEHVEGITSAAHATPRPKLRASAKLTASGLTVTARCDQPCVLKYHFAIYANATQSDRENVSGPITAGRTVTRHFALSPLFSAAARQHHARTSILLYAANRYGAGVLSKLTAHS